MNCFMVDRAGFEPAAFRFFSLMRTGRSLALIQAYQAELPAPALETMRGIKQFIVQKIRRGLVRTRWDACPDRGLGVLAIAVLSGS